MKTKLLLSALILLSPLSFLLSPCTGQVPMGFNYQAIARDGVGGIIANTPLPVKITIQTSTGTVIYEELFSSVTTNQFGLISLVIGSGVWQSGSAATLSAIDWKSQPLYLKTTIRYPGLTWTVMGTSQIWGVPYSLLAKDVQGPLSKLGINGTTTDMEEALFEVKNQAGKTVFAVYNEGIRAYVGNGSAKGVKGGFSVGGYDASKSDTIRNIFVLSTDSARFYLDSKPHNGTKGVRGGFSVGGYDMTKGAAQNYLQISKDSVRIYVDSNPATKGARGGFAVGGYDLTKGGVTVNKFLSVNPDSTRIFTTDASKGFGVGSLSTGVAESYLKLTPENYFIGHQSGKATTTGKFNSFLGYQTGLSNTQGGYNTILGYQAGYTNSVGAYNVFLGFKAGYASTSSFNTFLGYQAGTANSGGQFNAFMGYNAGLGNLNGSSNVFIGNESGKANTSGNNNVFLGFNAGLSNSQSGDNTFIGYKAGSAHLDATRGGNVYIGSKAGENATNGQYNILIGESAGAGITNGIKNVFLGYQTGLANTTGYSNVFIGILAGTANVSGISNVIIGDEAGESVNSSQNIFIGKWAGRGCTSTGYNIFIGTGSGSGTTGNDNTFLGNSSGYSNTSGATNTFVGSQAGASTLTGSCNAIFGGMAGYGSYNNSFSNNSFFGYQSGYKASTGGNNTFMGYKSGYTATTGSGNTLIGYMADVSISSLSNATAIGNGAIANDNNKIVIGNASATTVGGYGAWTNYSDSRLKENIVYKNDLGLDFILRLNTVSFNYIADENKRRRDGLIAQDVQKVLKDMNLDFSGLVVDNDKNNTLNLSYGEFVIPLINAVKEQQKQIESYKSENENLKSQLQTLEEKVRKIEVALAKGSGN